MNKASRAVTFALGTLLLCTAILYASDRPSLPMPTGFYGIGRVSYELTDTSRPEPLSSKSNARRRMMVYVWYPTDRKAMKGKATAPYLPGFDKVRSRIKPGDVAGFCGAVASTACYTVLHYPGSPTHD